MAYHFGRALVDYVGYTKNPYRRISEHFDQFANAANFTTLHPPIRLSGIRWYESEDKAKSAEKRRAKKLRRTGSFINPSLFHTCNW